MSILPGLAILSVAAIFGFLASRAAMGLAETYFPPDPALGFAPMVGVVGFSVFTGIMIIAGAIVKRRFWPKPPPK